jgi:hypothetical protein
MDLARRVNVRGRKIPIAMLANPAILRKSTPGSRKRHGAVNAVLKNLHGHAVV